MQDYEEKVNSLLGEIHTVVRLRERRHEEGRDYEDLNGILRKLKLELMGMELKRKEQPENVGRILQ